jgi:hypothetical protein
LQIGRIELGDHLACLDMIADIDLARADLAVDAEAELALVALIASAACGWATIALRGGAGAAAWLPQPARANAPSSSVVAVAMRIGEAMNVSNMAWCLLAEYAHRCRRVARAGESRKSTCRSMNFCSRKSGFSAP